MLLLLLEASQLSLFAEVKYAYQDCRYLSETLSVTFLLLLLLDTPIFFVLES